MVDRPRKERDLTWCSNVSFAKRLTPALLVCSGSGSLAVDAAPSFAGNCGGHCQVMKRCAELVKEKGVAKGAAFQSEFNKCMTDSANYK